MADFWGEPKFDGGRFDARRWYVDGYGRFWFSTKEDAEAAVDLAKAVSLNAERKLAQKIQDILP